MSMTDDDLAIRQALLEPAPAAPHVNGTAPKGPRIQRTEVWRELEAPYEGFRIKFWFDHPAGLMNGLDDGARINEAVATILLEHNGWEDDQGVLPQPSDPAFMERVPTHLLVATLAVVRIATTTLPNSVTQTRRR